MTARWMPALLMVAMSLPGWGQSQPRRALRSRAHQVAQTLSGNGIQIMDEQVSLLANVVATEPAPMLDILSVEPLGDRAAGRRYGAPLSGQAGLPFAWRMSAFLCHRELRPEQR